MPAYPGCPGKEAVKRVSMFLLRIYNYGWNEYTAKDYSVSTKTAP